MPGVSGRGSGFDRKRPDRRGHRLEGRRRRLGDAKRHANAVSGDIADARPDQVEEVALDPVPDELVRNRELERIGVELHLTDAAEPRLVRRLVKCLTQPSRDVAPEALRRQLDLTFHLP